MSWHLCQKGTARLGSEHRDGEQAHNQGNPKLAPRHAYPAPACSDISTDQQSTDMGQFRVSVN